MAAIDRIYLKGYDKYKEFKDWCEKQPPLTDKYGRKVQISNYLVKFTKDEWGENDDTHGVLCAPHYVDSYIIRNCPIREVREELMVNYNHWSQKRIKDFYDAVVNWKSDEHCPFWAKKEDFTFNDDGTITLEGIEDDDEYAKILKGELYVKPSLKYEVGKHFNLKHIQNATLRDNTFLISIDVADTSLEYNNGTWDFAEEFVDCIRGKSSYCFLNAHSKKALARTLRKWKLPVSSLVYTLSFKDCRFEIEIKK